MRIPGLKNPDILLTDTVGFIQKLPTNLVAAFRATLEEISEADILLVSRPAVSCALSQAISDGSSNSDQVTCSMIILI